MIRDAYPGCRIRIFYLSGGPGSWIQRSKKHRISEPEHCLDPFSPAVPDQDLPNWSVNTARTHRVQYPESWEIPVQGWAGTAGGSRRGAARSRTRSQTGPPAHTGYLTCNSTSQVQILHTAGASRRGAARSRTQSQTGPPAHTGYLTCTSNSS